MAQDKKTKNDAYQKKAGSEFHKGADNAFTGGGNAAYQPRNSGIGKPGHSSGGKRQTEKSMQAQQETFGQKVQKSKESQPGKNSTFTENKSMDSWGSDAGERKPNHASKAHAVWDSETQDYYVTGDGTVPTFATPEEADVFCRNLNGDLQRKEAENIVTEPGTVSETKDTASEPENVTEETEQPGTEDVSGTKDSAEKDDFPDIDTQAVREGLEKAGIVDGRLVDENALENDPFIRQVMGDVETLTGGNPPEPGKVPQKEPEIDKTGAANYRISFNEAENIGKGFAPKEKFRQNVEAIRTLEKIEMESVTPLSRWKRRKNHYPQG